MRTWYPKLLCLGLLVAAQAEAQDSFLSKTAITGGVSIGQLSLDNDAFRGPVPPAPGVQVRGYESTNTAWMPSVGFEINRYLALDLGLWTGGSPSQEILIAAPPGGTGAGTYIVERDEIRNHGWLASAIGSLPINDVVSVYARGGILSWKTSARIEQRSDVVNSAGDVTATSSLFFRADKDGTDPFYGVGVALNIDSGIVRLEYAQSTINNADARYISIGFAWRFRPWAH